MRHRFRLFWLYLSCFDVIVFIVLAACFFFVYIWELVSAFIIFIYIELCQEQKISTSASETNVALAHSKMPVCIVKTIQYKKKYTKLEYWKIVNTKYICIYM